MFEKFFHAEAGEFRQRYEGTYGFFVGSDGKKLLSRIEMIDTESRPRCVEFRDARGAIFTLNADAQGEVGFEFLPPKSAFYNTSKGVYYVERRAARQFQRGVSENNTRIFLLRHEGFAGCSVHFDHLAPIYEQEIPFEVAYEAYKEGKAGVALSKNFLLAEETIYLLANIIGKVVKMGDGYTIILKRSHSIFKQEVLDAFRRVKIFNIKVK